MKTRAQRIDAALQYLNQLIDQGREFPDASVTAAILHGVTVDEVRAAYDEKLATNLDEVDVNL